MVTLYILAHKCDLRIHVSSFTFHLDIPGLITILLFNIPSVNFVHFFSSVSFSPLKEFVTMIFMQPKSLHVFLRFAIFLAHNLFLFLKLTSGITFIICQLHLFKFLKRGSIYSELLVLFPQNIFL